MNGLYPAKAFAIGLTVCVVALIDWALIAHHAGIVGILFATVVLAPITFFAIILGGGQLLMVMALIILAIAFLFKGIGKALTWFGDGLLSNWDRFQEWFMPDD
jgi:hypothetical protein